jgi:DnaJ like chaperone protein
MRGWSKAVGAGLGYFVGGPIGAVLGYMAGHKLAPRTQAAAGHLLIANLLGFATLFLKANGTPSAEERKQTVGFISRLFRFDAEDERMAGELLDRLLAMELDALAMARTFKKHSDAQMRLRLLEILATLCLLIHCPLAKHQVALLTETAEALELTQGQWQALKSRFQTPTPTLDAACCYALLEIYPEVSESEIRAAYRRLAKKYHPDLVAHLDLAAQQGRIERMTLINAAYATIRAQRDF